MTHKLMDLPFDFTALSPHMDARTVEVHYTKHHQSYVNNLNAALEKYPELSEKSLEYLLKNLETIPEDIQVTVRNNAGGTYNHNLFWNSLSPNGGTLGSNEISKKIEEEFSSFDNFKEQFSNLAAKHFASGWAWLTIGQMGKLKIQSTSGHDTPLSWDDTPLLVIDVWEHAYYLKYENRRADFINAWWEIVDWEKVNKRFLNQ